MDVRRGGLVLRGDAARERVAVLEERDVDAERAADHLRDRDRLADRAAEPEHHCGDEPAARLRQDDAADHLPARRAERERGLLEIARAR